LKRIYGQKIGKRVKAAVNKKRNNGQKNQNKQYQP